MKSLITVLRTEMLKSRRTFAAWQTFLFPLFTVFLVTLSYSTFKIEDPNPWIRYVYNLNNTTSFFLPFFLIFIIAYYAHVEYKSNTWKHLLTQPVPKFSLFSGKLLMIVILILISWLLILLFGYLGSWILHLARPGKFHYDQGGIEPVRFLKTLLKTYLCGAAIVAIQYWLSIRMKNLVLPVITGISLIILPIAVLVILGMTGVLNQPESLKHIFTYDPYSYPFSNLFNFTRGPDQQIVLFPRMTLLFLAAAVVITGLAYLDFRKRNF